MRVVAPVVLAVVTLAACGGDSGDDRTSATLGVATTAAPTTNGADPYAVPAVIDEAYVNRVLAGLDAAVGDVVRLVVREKALTPEAMERLKALYGTNQALQLKVDSFNADLGSGLSGYKTDPGNKASSVTEVISSTPSCIYVSVQRDYSAVGSAPDLTASTEWIGLKTIDDSANPSSYNPTPWALVAEGFREDGSALENPCGE